MKTRPDRTFRIGQHIWFILHYGEDGMLDGLQEHDWREGGGLPLSTRFSCWEEQFVARAQDRCTDRAGAYKAANDFLKSDVIEFNMYPQE